MALDILVWFNGVEILWSNPSCFSLWVEFTPAEWWSQLMMPVEFRFFTLFFYWLRVEVKKDGGETG